MNDPLDLVDRLAARARQHAPQPLSVADDVVRRLRASEHTPLVWLTACAVAVTLLVLTTIGLPNSNADPLDTLFQVANFIHPEGGL